MKNIVFILILILFSSKKTFGQESKFRIDYNYVSIYTDKDKEWSDWKEGYNTFVINFNYNNDILHIKGDGSKVVYRRLSGVKEGSNNSGEEYQILRALDEDGDAFEFQVYNNSEIGAKMIYENFMIQFSKQ